MHAKAEFNMSEYLKRCEAVPQIAPQNIAYCTDAVKNYSNQIQKNLQNLARETVKLENKNTPPSTADLEKKGRLQEQARKMVAQIENVERTQTSLNLDEEIKKTDYDIQSLERYLSQLDVMTPEEDRAKPAYKDNIAIHQANLAELRKKSNDLWQERMNRTATLNQSDSIKGQREPNPTQGFIPVENAPAQTATPAPISQSASNPPAPTREVRQIPLGDLEREVSQQELNSLNRQIAHRDVENRFDSLRLQNAGLQVRLSALQRRYDNALMGHYIKAKFGKLLQSVVFCEKSEECISNSTTDIQNLDSKVKTQIFTEVK